ncbi:O-methyltransferase [Planomonospora corallina]|uniref:O-methyltransferase n=1 Tax=Planomonospora corallina TaxID=1806052 RepID=A0ABV8ID82_9ACTN
MSVPYLDPAVGQYMRAHSSEPDDLLEALAARARETPGIPAGLQISADQGRFLTMITQAARARTAVEVSPLTGYSTLCLARGLSARGRLTCFADSREPATLAQPYWEQAGVAGRIVLRIGPIAERLPDLPFVPAVDVAFVNADAADCDLFYTILLPHLASGGLMLVAGTLRDGRIARPAGRDEATRAMDEFNESVAADDRVGVIMLAVGGGLTMIRKH